MSLTPFYAKRPLFYSADRIPFFDLIQFLLWTSSFMLKSPSQGAYSITSQCQSHKRKVCPGGRDRLVFTLTTLIKDSDKAMPKSKH